MKQTTSIYRPELQPILTGDKILRLQETVRQVVVAEHVFQYAANLVRATRPREPGTPAFIAELVSWEATRTAGQPVPHIGGQGAGDFARPPARDHRGHPGRRLSRATPSVGHHL